MGWRGSARHWSIYETAALLMAGMSTPLVLSVHTVVSFDFTIAIVPGWHSTFFPPYFVAGAIYSGFAMVLVLAIPIRAVYGLQGLVTDRHLENSAKIMLATGLIVAYAYIMETFMAWYSGNALEQQAFWNRMTGPYSEQYWFLVFCNIVAPQALWFRKFRRTPALLFLSSIVVLIGMWLERFMIIVSSLAQDFVPSSWGLFHATRWDWATLWGSIGLFLVLFFLFVRLLPMISIFEVRTLLPQAKVREGLRT
jgi:molybdopterin-containing oxidoreductase family membrane subunit